MAGIMEETDGLRNIAACARRKRHPLAKIKGGWTPEEDAELIRWAKGTVRTMSWGLNAASLQLHIRMTSGLFLSVAGSGAGQCAERQVAWGPERAGVSSGGLSS